jgi:arylsulfatase A
MGPLRGLKRDLWEGGHRVPMIIRWPGKVPAGKVNNGLFSQIDLYSTLVKIVGSDVPAGNAEDSYDQRALITSSGPSTRNELVHNTNPNGYAIRQGDWVLINARSGAVSKVPDWFAQANGYEPNKQPGELYNLREDLSQRNNRYADEPQRVEELSKLLEQIRSGKSNE